MAMITLLRTSAGPFIRLPGLVSQLIAALRHRALARRRRQTTIDLIHASPHLRRDIGLLEEHFSVRGR